VKKVKNCVLQTNSEVLTPIFWPESHEGHCHTAKPEPNERVTTDQELFVFSSFFPRGYQTAGSGDKVILSPISGYISMLLDVTWSKIFLF
jgi:hypothetical protein